MQSFTRTTRRAVLVSCVAGVAVIGAVGVGSAAFADGSPTPSTSQSASTGSEGRDAGPDHQQHEPHIGGTVLTVSGSTVTVRDRDGFTRTIRLADTATVTKDDASSSASAIAKGVHVEATGSVASDGTTLNATTVRIGQPPRPGAGRPGPGREGGARKHPTGAPATLPTGAPTAPSGSSTPSATS